METPPGLANQSGVRKLHLVGASGLVGYEYPKNEGVDPRVVSVYRPS
jgi:hypothetical protein